MSLDMLGLHFGEGQEARAFISVLLSMMVTSQKKNEGGDDDEARCQQADEPKLVAALLGLDHVLYLHPHPHAPSQNPACRPP